MIKAQTSENKNIIGTQLRILIQVFAMLDLRISLPSIITFCGKSLIMFPQGFGTTNCSQLNRLSELSPLLTSQHLQFLCFYVSCWSFIHNTYFEPLLRAKSSVSHLGQ